MGGYYKLDKHEARQLSMMVGQLATDRSRVSRAHMALFLWSQMQANGKPCPFFRTGIRTLAHECGVTSKAARTFIECAEERGWIVRVGDERNRSGQYTKRTFLWVAEEAAEESDRGLDEWLRSVGGVPQKGHGGVPQKGHTGGTKPQQVRAHGCAPDHDETAGSEVGPGTHQSTEYSEGDATRLSPEVEALASQIGVRPQPRPEWWQS